MVGEGSGSRNMKYSIQVCIAVPPPTPTRSACTNTLNRYMKRLYKYPQWEFPYADLEAESGRRGVLESKYEILDTGEYRNTPKLDRLIWANSADSDQTAPREAV